jgi:hypothetical protein
MVPFCHAHDHRLGRTGGDPQGDPRPARLSPGADVELAEADGGVEIRPAPAEIELVEVDGRLVARADGLPALTDEIARETIERVRR